MDKSTLLDFYKQRGISDETIRDYSETTSAVLRGLHYAATDINIGHIKKRVADKQDPTKERTVISGMLNRHVSMKATSSAMKSGEVSVKDKTTGAMSQTPYCQYNSGMFSVKVSHGKGCPEIDEEQKKSAEELIAASGFGPAGNTVDSTAE